MKIRIKKVDTRKVLWVFFMVIIYFAPDFKFLPHYTWGLSALGLFVCFFNGNGKRIGINKKENIDFIICMFFCVIVALLTPIFHFTFDFTYLVLISGIILCILRNYLVASVVEKHLAGDGDAIDLFMDLFLDACCVCVAFTIIFIIAPGFKDFWINNVVKYEIAELNASFSAYEFRYSIGGFAAFSYATLFSFAIVMEAYLICKKISTFEMIRFGIIAIGCIFYGRVTVFAILFAIIMIITRGENIGKTIAFTVSGIILVALFLLVLNKLESSDDRFAVWSNWAFSFVEDIVVRKQITTHSVSHMVEDMYFWPGIKTFLIGDGLYTEVASGRYYGHTDIGYMRLMLYSGVLGAIGVLLPVFFLAKKLHKMSLDYDFKRFIIFSLFTWIVLEAKGESWMRFLLLYYPIFLFMVSSKYKQLVLTEVLGIEKTN